MRIAVVGSGIAGLASAWMLSRQHDVVLFEASAHLGGHTHTHDVELGGCHYVVDTGFIVHNPAHYPLFTRLLAELEVRSQPTTMSFSVRNDDTGLEYNATKLDTLFCQRRNLVSPRFLGMVRDLVRFYRVAPALLDGEGDGPNLGDYLAEHRFGAAFRDEHLVPMVAALWSSPAAQVLSFPARYLVHFLANHNMLQVAGRPQWRVVRGGSRCYVDAMRARWQVETRPATPVLSMGREADCVVVRVPSGIERFDQVVLACHSDQALALLADPDERERDILGAIEYHANDTVLHTDAGVLPRNRKAWAAWNVRISRRAPESCTMSYWMNVLQGIVSPVPFVVTLNGSETVDPEKVLRRMRYEHPVYTHASVAAQRRKAEIQGRRRTWFAGAYWGWGFHEDGLRSAIEIARGLGGHWPQPNSAVESSRCMASAPEPSCA